MSADGLTTTNKIWGCFTHSLPGFYVFTPLYLIVVLISLSLPFNSRADADRASGSTNAGYKDALTGMEFIFVKGGCFEMGDTFGDGYFAERPVHEVCVDDFYVGKYEVTRAEWEYACRSGGKRERFAGFHNKGHLYRYANFCDVNCNYDWVTGDQDDGYKDSSPAGNYRPNNLGLYDMSGNAWEWVADWFDEGYYKRSKGNNPKGPQSGQDRVVRGGCWLNSPNYLRCSYRFGLNPTLRENDVGFRIVMEKP